MKNIAQDRMNQKLLSMVIAANGININRLVQVIEHCSNPDVAYQLLTDTYIAPHIKQEPSEKAIERYNLKDAIDLAFIDYDAFTDSVNLSYCKYDKIGYFAPEDVLLTEQTFKENHNLKYYDKAEWATYFEDDKDALTEKELVTSTLKTYIKSMSLVIWNGES